MVDRSASPTLLLLRWSLSALSQEIMFIVLWTETLLQSFNVFCVWEKLFYFIRNVFSFYVFWGYFVFYCVSSWKKQTFYIANGFRRSWCFYRSHLLKTIENVFVANCSTYLSIYYRYSAFCSCSLPVLMVSILAARQGTTFERARSSAIRSFGSQCSWQLSIDSVTTACIQLLRDFVPMD